MRNFTLQSVFAPKKRLLLLIILCCITAEFSNAQNMIVNGDFGTFDAAIPMPPLSGFQTDYGQIAYDAGISSGGKYAITNNPFSVNNEDFQNLDDKTTGTSAGNMLVVDGQSDQFFWKQHPDKQLQAGVTYTFSYWVANVNNVTNIANPAPKIRFNPQGCSTCSVQILDVGTLPPGWNQVTYTITPATTQWVRIDLSTVGAGEAGNDFAIDDITLFGPPLDLSITNTQSNPTCIASNDGTIIAYAGGGVPSYTFTLNGPTPSSNTTGIFTGLAPGTYSLSVSDSQSPPDTAFIPSIILTEPLNLDVSADKTGCLLPNTPVVLSVVNGSAPYTWSAPAPVGTIAGTGNSITVTPSVTTEYTVASTINSSIAPVNLITNPGFEIGNTGFFSNYGYSPTIITGTNGQIMYGIDSNPANVYASFNSCGDHSGIGGKMFVADGSTAVGTVVWSQSVPVESAMTYNFSFWAQNVTNSNFAKFKVLINGTQISLGPVSAGNTGAAAPTGCGWTEIKGTWTASSTIATIKIIDEDINSAGNDFAIDDISFMATASINKSCALSDKIEVNIGGTTPVTSFSYTTPVCKTGTNPTPTGATGFDTTGTYSSTPLGLDIDGDSGIINLAGSAVGTYTVRYDVAEDVPGCKSAGFWTTSITINEVPTVTVNNPTVCAGSTATVTATPGTAGSYDYAWTVPASVPSPGNVASFSTTVAGNYSVIITNTTTNCPSASASGNVTVNTVPTVTVNNPVVCAGSTATVTATPGTAGTYDYAWTVPASAPSPGNVASFSTTVAGNYSVIITNTTTNCPSASASGTVTVNAVPTVIVNNPAVCAGSTATVTATPGTAGSYDYAWTVPASVASPGNVASFSTTVAGNYSVIITNTTTNCPSVSALGTVSISTVPTVTVNNPTVCAGSAATVLATPGTAGSYDYAWTVPASAPSPGNVASFSTTVAGNYSVVITNITTTCFSASASGTVTVNAVPTVTVNNPVVCAGSTATVTATPGTAGTYDYAWTVPASAPSPGNVASFSTTVAGNYSVIITNTTTNCSSISASGTVTINPLPTVTVSNPTVCAGSTATVTATPGTAGSYDYAWTVPASAASPGNVASFSTTVAGNYSVIITNTTTNCSSISASGTVTVNPLPTVTVNNPTVCAGSTANVTATPGAAGSYDYAWTVPASAPSPGNVASFSTTVAGNYSVIITNTTTNCPSASASGTVTVNAVPTVIVNNPAVCAGSTATVTATPGTAGSYDYAWTVPASVASPGNVASFSTTVAGNYSVIITNTTTNCPSVSASGTVTINPLPTVTVNNPTVCAGSTATVTATPGAAGSYDYAWTVPASAPSPGNVASFSTTVAGNYSVIITNTTTNCPSASASGTVTVNSVPTVIVNNPTVCSGSTANVTATPGAAGSYDYAWTVPASAASPGNVASFSTTVAGNYSVIITNTTTNCFSASASGTVTVNAVPTVIVNNPAVCAGSTATVTATPETAGSYDYAWTVPASVPSPGNVASFSTTVAGNYSVIITNTTTNCPSVSASGTVTINPLPTVTVNNPTVCAGSTATVTATPGTAGSYDYAWTVPASAASPGNVASFSTAVAGNYSVVITNTTTNCSSISASGTVTVNPLPTVTVNNPTVCAGSAATVTATPGTAGSYDYAWTVPASAPSPGNVASFSTAVAGNYSVIITNTTTNCPSISASGTVTINSLPTVTVNNPTVCAGSTATVTATPGTAGSYDYAWTVPASASSPGNVASFSTTVAGNYSVIITNTITNCSSVSASGTVTVNSVPTVTVNNPTVCAGSIATVTATPGTAGSYDYAWTVPASVASPGNVASFSTTVAGNYSVIITNTTTNCPSASASGTVTINAVPTVIVNNPAVCAGSAATVTATPGTAGSYDYAWTVPASAPSPGNVASFSTTVAGNYSVIITNTTTNCPSVSASGTVTINPLPTVTVNNPTVCAGSTATVTATPGTAGSYDYAWTVPASAPSPGNVASFSTTVAGNYSVIITNTITNCFSTSASGNVTINAVPIVDYTGTTDICSGQVPSIVWNSTVPGTTYSWNAVQNNATGALAGSGTINQILTVTGNNMGQVVYNVTPTAGTCKGQPKEIIINVSPVPNVFENTPKKILCSGEETNIVLSSDIVRATFSWTANPTGVRGSASGTGAEIKQTLSNLDVVPGTVDYVITPEINGCTGTAKTVTITVKPMPEVFGTPPGTICSGATTTINLSPSIVGTAFDWTVDEHAVTGATEGNGVKIEQTLETSGTSQGFVVYKITPSLDGCIGSPKDIEVKVDPLPRPVLENGVICVEEATGVAFKTFTLDSGLRDSDYNFKWYFNTLAVEGASLSTLEADQFGDYTVEATNNDTGCKATSDVAKVSASYPGLSLTTTQTSAFADNAKVEVKVTGGNAVFEYQLDGGSFQSSNVFQYLTPGPHTITVGDENGCTNLTENFFVIGYPKFFTPNGDDRNKRWNVVGLEGQPKAVIYIFDRYGKLIKQISPGGEGWDGSYSGQPLPATDYWFTVEFMEESQLKLFKAHFSLLR